MTDQDYVYLDGKFSQINKRFDDLYKILAEQTNLANECKLHHQMKNSKQDQSIKIVENRVNVLEKSKKNKIAIITAIITGGIISAFNFILGFFNGKV